MIGVIGVIGFYRRDGRPGDPRVSFFRITNGAGFVDLFAGQANVGGVRRCRLQTFRLGTFAYGRNLPPLAPRRIRRLGGALPRPPCKMYRFRV